MGHQTAETKHALDQSRAQCSTTNPFLPRWPHMCYKLCPHCDSCVSGTKPARLTNMTGPAGSVGGGGTARPGSACGSTSSEGLSLVRVRVRVSVRHLVGGALAAREHGAR